MEECAAEGEEGQGQIPERQKKKEARAQPVSSRL
jgi:hypothetical protein